ncbi:MAG: response regulator [Sediminibacterium sp.]
MAQMRAKREGSYSKVLACQDMLLKVSKCRLLIVDDDEVNRALLHFLLQSFDCITADAINGEEALKHLNLGKNIPTIVLLDLNMPIMDGYEVIKAIKNNKEAYPLTRIIVISATSYQNFIKREDPCHISGYIQKPIDKTKLLQLLADAANEVINLQQLKIK